MASKKRKKILEIDVGLYLNLIADHLVHCPKIKFAGDFKKSIESTKVIMRTALQTLTQIIEYNQKHGVRVKSKVNSKNDLVTLIAAQSFTQDPEVKKAAIGFFLMYSKFYP